jgi:hypothetical protein
MSSSSIRFEEQGSLRQVKTQIQAGNLPEVQKSVDKIQTELTKDDLSNFALLACSFGNLEILVSLREPERLSRIAGRRQLRPIMTL